MALFLLNILFVFGICISHNRLNRIFKEGILKGVDK